MKINTKTKPSSISTLPIITFLLIIETTNPEIKTIAATIKYVMLTFDYKHFALNHGNFFRYFYPVEISIFFF